MHVQVLLARTLAMGFRQPLEARLFHHTHRQSHPVRQHSPLLALCSFPRFGDASCNFLLILFGFAGKAVISCLSSSARISIDTSFVIFGQPCQLDRRAVFQKDC